LSKIAFDFLLILAISSKYKRLFSYTKHYISYERHSLYIDLINILQCLKN
ncbi:uncharacterized protein THITE_2053250, partial [Thermothielavioides terrestris NRRL 8126]